MVNKDLTEIQRLAEDANHALIPSFDEDQRWLGGDLFLGMHYEETPRIFLGLNPGGEGEGNRFKTDLCDSNLWDAQVPAEGYWGNCKFFVNAENGLHDWLDRATVSFCSPWRTRGAKELKKLNASTGCDLYMYSGRLVRTLVRHHRENLSEEPITLIVVGKASLDLVARQEFLDFDARRVVDECGAGGMFRCRKVEANSRIFPELRPTVYQIPHFSWARGPRLESCAKWLAGHVLPCGKSADVRPTSAVPRT